MSEIASGLTMGWASDEGTVAVGELAVIAVGKIDGVRVGAGLSEDTFAEQASEANSNTDKVSLIRIRSPLQQITTEDLVEKFLSLDIQ